jgi:hypothetical protein
MKYLIMFTTSTIFLLLLSACGQKGHAVSKKEGGFYYSGIYFGKNFSPALKQGVADGCETSKGYYTKNHTLFNTETDYNTGWFLGRRRCIPLLKVEEDQDTTEPQE